MDPAELCSARLAKNEVFSMKRLTFIVCGIFSLIVVLSGFVVTFLHQFLLSLLLIAAGGIIFYFVLKKAKKEEWFGKPVKK